MHIRGVDETTARRMRFLSIGLNKTMAKLLETMVSDYWDRYSDTIFADSRSKRLFKRITKRKPIAI